MYKIEHFKNLRFEHGTYENIDGYWLEVYSQDGVLEQSFYFKYMKDIKNTITYLKHVKNNKKEGVNNA